MIAPRPSAERSSSPTTRLSWAPDSCVSATRASVGWSRTARAAGRGWMRGRSPWAGPISDWNSTETSPAPAAATLGPVPPFKLDTIYTPTADQPAAVDSLAAGLAAGERSLTLLGATGTGKTMTMAATIERIQRPTLVMAHNKTLAAQLCNEFRTYFPHNAVEYFVSYYDYYQPEAYVPSRDLYIEKDSAINQEIDRLRHAATAALFARRDVLIVASVSCIFGLGSPETYNDNVQILLKGSELDRDELLRKLVMLQYTRNDTALGRGTFRVRTRWGKRSASSNRPWSSPRGSTNSPSTSPNPKTNSAIA